MRMFNKLFYNSKAILRNTLYQLDFVMSYKRKNDSQSAEYNEKVIALLEKKHMLEQLRAKGYMPDALFLSQTKAIDKELGEIRVDKAILYDTRLENTYSEIKKLITIIEDYGQEMVTFDEDIFDAIVTKTVITPDGEIQFTLMGNISFTERL